MAKVKEGAKCDLMFVLPRTYMEQALVASRRQGHSSLAAWGRKVLLDALREEGLVDAHNRPREVSPEDRALVESRA